MSLGTAWTNARDFARRRPITAIAIGVLAAAEIPAEILMRKYDIDPIQLAMEYPKVAGAIVLGGLAADLLILRSFVHYRRECRASIPLGPQ
jgi:hypothetical protein